LRSGRRTRSRTTCRRTGSFSRGRCSGRAPSTWQDGKTATASSSRRPSRDGSLLATTGAPVVAGTNALHLAAGNFSALTLGLSANALTAQPLDLQGHAAGRGRAVRK